MKVETCSNCERVIGKLEPACVFRGNVVCQNCYQKLTDIEDRQAQAEVQNPMEVKVEPIPSQAKQKKSKHKVAAFTILFSCLAFLAICIYIYQTVFLLPALSEKDAKLIEGFIYEMNLLDSASSIDFEAQYTKLDAASKNFDNIGSSNYPMSRISGLASIVCANYRSAHTLLESGKYEEYEERVKDVSKSRENFIKAYRLWQDRAAISEFDKFLEDIGYDKRLARLIYLFYEDLRLR